MTGKFWESRFKAVRLLDEELLLACAVYVDLNPILRRHWQRRSKRATSPPYSAASVVAVNHRAAIAGELPRRSTSVLLHGRVQSASAGLRRATAAAIWGSSPIRLDDYLQLLNWTARQVEPSKRGLTPTPVPPILERLSLDPQSWCEMSRQFGRLFSHVARVSLGRWTNFEAA